MKNESTEMTNDLGELKGNKLIYLGAFVTGEQNVCFKNQYYASLSSIAFRYSNIQ